MRVSCRFLNLSATVAGHPRVKRQGFFDTDAALDNSPFEVVARMRRESRSRDRQKGTAHLTSTAKALPWNCSNEAGGTVLKEWIHSADYRSMEDTPREPSNELPSPGPKRLAPP